MKTLLTLWMLLAAGSAQAFCGFYVAKAGTDLFNEASKVVLVRDGDRTVITMASDYQGEAKDFAMVVPVPEVLTAKQINIGDAKVVEHLDAYTAPRLVEYHDPNPCEVYTRATTMGVRGLSEAGPGSAGGGGGKGFGVTVEAKYEVGEYDILILSAKESGGLQAWLTKQGYKMPRAARSILASYIKQGLKFFVAKVNLERHSKSEATYLRPLQMAFEAKRFELPIRLGTLNAKASQDIFVFALTRKGRVEVTNYQTKKLPTGMEIPTFVKSNFPAFYKDMFSQLVKKDEMKHVYTEYAWDMNWCDPCAADPLTPKELRSLGVFWVKDQDGNRTGSRNVFVTRLHARYSAKTFPQDLKLQVTSDRNNFQGRYVMRHPYTGDADCKRMAVYKKELKEKQEKRAFALAELTGWKVDSIRKKMDLQGTSPSEESWIDSLWDN